MRSPLNIFLAICFIVVLALTFLVRPDPTKRNVEFLPNMVFSVAYETMSENPNFSNGMTQQSSVAGTIPRGYKPLHYSATPEEALRAGNELTNPFTAGDEKHVARGAAAYGTFCFPCHGGAGLGDGPVTKFGYPPPPSLLAERALAMKDGQLFHVLSYGQGNMPSYASQVSADDRWNIVLHIRALQVKATEGAQK